MPGIAGFIGRDHSKNRRSDLARMTSLMMHETSYSSGTYLNEGMGVFVGMVGGKVAVGPGVGVAGLPTTHSKL